ncbi:ras-related protein RHN1-like isoform X3 [Arachis ipaensis]|uniref:ras-related protein RHN1-like isoform X3 n=1 Tax=Arachis ipaensis TaxID=130454 RepID=UPI0007AFADD6|nr:ras-related protein RHN1-like isoform X3 [Arachis ipaensis]XP_029150901.1 ras-related protein RHN1 isoform X3 [Arachis hypogaea]
MMVSSSRNSIFCSCDRNHGGFDYSIKIVTQQDGKIRYIRKSRYFDNFIRQINDGKNYLGKKEESTIGAAFFTQVLSLNEATIKFDIWDTAGQERYHSLAPMYYRSAAAVIVVYDIISMESFARAKKWVQKMQRHANPSLIMFLVANKANLGAERKVTNEEGEEYAKENELSFLETSAKTAQNVNELFYEIEKGLAKANPSHQTGIKLHIIPQETRRRSLFCCV